MRHSLAPISWLLLLAPAVYGEGRQHQHQQQQQPSVKQVAVIGAGAAGSSAAFHLSRFGAADGVPLNVTVFEKTGRIGGRTLTVGVFGDEANPVELGASIFVEVNSIMYDASREFGLPVRQLGDEDSGLMVVWDGERVAFEQDDRSWSWWNSARLIWRYGTAPYRAQRLMRATVGSFLKLYEAPHFPFRSLSQRVFDLGLEKATAVTGAEYLAMNKVSGAAEWHRGRVPIGDVFGRLCPIGDAFGRDIVQAATRVNYASDLGFIHGLETMVSIATDGAMAVDGGNWRIFATMLERSNATVRVLGETAIASIGTKTAGSGEPAPAVNKYILYTQSSSASSASRPPLSAAAHDGAPEPYPVEFDSVIVATPWQFAGIAASDGVLPHGVDAIPYTQLHVTLFATPLRLSGSYLGMAPGAAPPATVLTTLAPGDVPRAGPDGAGKPGFYSVSTVGVFANPKTGRDEFAYKIFSPRPVDAALLSRLLGVAVPESVVAGGGGGGDAPAAEPAPPISWFLAHTFHSYPILHPRVTFQDPVLADGLYYTSGIESFISTMETSALMGKNVARLVVDDFLAGRDGQDEQQQLKQQQQQQQPPQGAVTVGEL